MLRLSKCLLGPVFTALIATPLASAQSPQPTTPPPSQSDITTLHTSTQLVVVNIVVTDKHQNPVHNLKASDFTVTEKGVPQQIKSFDEHSTAADPVKSPPMPQLPPGVFTNFSLAPTGGPIDILLLDMLNTPLADQQYARAQISKFLKNASPNTRIAIYGLNNHLTLLQGFTTDPQILRTAFDKFNTKSSNLVADNVGGGTALESASKAFRESSAWLGPGSEQVYAALKQFDAQTEASDIQVRTQMTLAALNQIARALSGIRGRKNLIWFSGSFPIQTTPLIDPINGSDLKDPFQALTGAANEIHDTDDLLAHSQVAVYPIDVRGVMSSPTNTAAMKNRTYVGEKTTAIGEENEFVQATISENTTMQQMADATGGRAFINTNDLTTSVAKSIDAGANYYTVSYSPSDTKWDGKFRTVQVKMQQPGLTLAYRRGYYADDPNAPPQKFDTAGAKAAATAKPLDAMQAAMLRGGPEPTQIIFKVRVLPASGPEEETVAANNIVNPAAKAVGPYRRYDLDYAASPREVAFTKTPEGTYKADVEFLTYLYDQDGKPYTVVKNQAHANLSPTEYATLMRSGIPWHQEISVPVKGTFYLRIGVHDLTSDRVAAVEVPVATVKNLPPSPTPPAATAAPPALEAKP